MFSQRSQFPHQQNALTLLLNERRALGLPVLDLTLSNPTLAHLDLPQEEIRRALVDGLEGPYLPEPFGLLPARQAVAHHLQSLNGPFPVPPPEQIVLTASTSEAYGMILTLLANPGEELLVPQPSYPLFAFLGQLSDVNLVPWPSQFVDGWQIDFAALEQAITPLTRAILAVSPNNPTGAALTHADLHKLADLCVQHELALIVDEVFADTSTEFLRTVAGHPHCLTFALGGLSKTLLLPQVKLAWTAVSGPPHLVAQALERLETMADTWLSLATPIQRALPHLLELKPRMQQVLQERLNQNLDYLDRLCTDTPIQRLPRAGGWSVVLRLPLPPGEREWALLLLEEGILTHPGWFFDLHGDGWLVLSLLPEPQTFQSGAKKLVEIVLRETGSQR